jgi:hypothetical protein
VDYRHDAAERDERYGSLIQAITTQMAKGTGSAGTPP